MAITLDLQEQEYQRVLQEAIKTKIIITPEILLDDDFLRLKVNEINDTTTTEEEILVLLQLTFNQRLLHEATQCCVHLKRIGKAWVQFLESIDPSERDDMFPPMDNEHQFYQNTFKQLDDNYKRLFLTIHKCF